MDISTFYKNTVLENENNRAWAGDYYGIFSKIINENNYKIVAEVGIGYGTHAKQILANTEVSKLYLIDPMKFYPNDGFAQDIISTKSISGDHFEDMYNLINEYLKPWSNKYIWFRKSSLSITNNEISDNSLDCVFIDGDHSYEMVKKDLYFWWNKVKVGGQLLGDDYWIEDVARAVHEFASENKLTVDFLTKENKTYKIYRFHK